MLFASLYLERQPLNWMQFPNAFGGWLQNAGAAAAFAVALVFLFSLLRRKSKEFDFLELVGDQRSLWTYLLYTFALCGITYGVLAICWVGNYYGISGMSAMVPRMHPGMPLTAGDWILSIAGGLTLFAVTLPILVDFATRIRVGRIWAIALLSWKEAIRGRVVWVFLSIALIFLFADWFIQYRAEDQLRTYVRVVYWSITPLFLILSGLLGAFSIPNDVKNNSIHTIVTKPVEKFEIVLGRFFGFASLLTVGLFSVAGLSLIYVVRGVTDEATQESYRARMPIYGNLHFVGTNNAQSGESVGREWSYRSYITNPTYQTAGKFRQFGLWDFWSIPTELGQRTEPVLFEFSFDIFRLSKGDEEGKGVRVSFSFVDPRVFKNNNPNAQTVELDDMVKKMKEERDRDFSEIARKYQADTKGKSDSEKTELAKKKRDEEEAIRDKYRKLYRIHQETGVEVFDYHTQRVLVPASAFTAFLSENDNRPEGENALPMLRVFLSVDRAKEAQMLGVAREDFYMVPYERPFWQNFLKGIIGMWCTHMLVLAIAVAMSTYSSSVISFIATIYLYLCGMSLDYMREIAEKRLDGGGPAASLVRITNGTPVATRLEASPTTTVINTIDDLFSWWIGRIMNMFPDVNRHDLHLYVANGFDISWTEVLLLDNGLPLFGYLLPWAVLSYYMMKFREIANPQ